MHKSINQIKLSCGENVLIGKLNESKASKDLIELLPLSIKLTDLFGVKKYSLLPEYLSESGQQMHQFEVGDIAYWSPGPGIVIFYRQYKAMVDSGLYKVGRIESGIQLLRFEQFSALQIELI
ncbi:cyclophilin-like fold protein [Emticicia sp. C21]|uniref:cyclophilin-like fold protein n=1 Tax=Emticicia sp. C21 TaxID=2302915 RepID=UPI001314C5AE|nr:cyclophilin-like fold protein [Emticicia sp. C21]